MNELSRWLAYRYNNFIMAMSYFFYGRANVHSQIKTKIRLKKFFICCKYILFVITVIFVAWYIEKDLPYLLKMFAKLIGKPYEN